MRPSLHALNNVRTFLMRAIASGVLVGIRHDEMGHLGPLEKPVDCAERALALYRSLDDGKPQSRL